jgi:DNA topoisomerase I
VVRLRRVSPDRPGWTRRRSGKGFVYLDENGRRISDPAQIERLRGLVAPPAWRDVWLCPLPNGHIQAVGTDERGRRQYLYHPQWQLMRAREKHARVLDFARALPAARLRVSEHLTLPGLPRERVLATAFRLLDLGLFRIGSESYAEENGSYGLATVQKSHVRINSGVAVFDYAAKSGLRRTVGIADQDVVAVIEALKRRRGGGPDLLAWQHGRQWSDLVSSDINGYVKDLVGPRSSAKDFRTWHATVLAAVSLAQAELPGSNAAAKRAVARAMREVSEQLGNTPTVCRASYVDPRVIDRFYEGTTIRKIVRKHSPASADRSGALVDEALERAVLRLLKS